MEFQKKRKIEVVAMEKEDSSGRRCEVLDINILVMAFLSFGLFQLIYAIPQVCRAWRLTCCDPHLWKMLDLSVLYVDKHETHVQRTCPGQVEKID